MGNLSDFNYILEKIKSVKAQTVGGKRRPHKFLLLLSLAKLYEEDPGRKNSFPLSEELEQAFEQTWKKFLPDADFQHNYIEFPYYHLKNDGFWQLKVKSERKVEYDQYEQNPKARLTRRRLIETVETAMLDPQFDAAFRDGVRRKKIVSALRNELSRDMVSDYGRIGIVREEQAPYSLFSHEKDALEEIGRRLKSQDLGIGISNLEIHDPESNRYLETDLIVVSPVGIYVVELKHWSGEIEVRPHSWIQNRSFYKNDPHKANNFKAKLLKGLYERQFPSFPNLYVESVVILTNPDVTVSGASNPSTDDHNPTFEGIERFIRYLVKKNNSRSDLLKKPQRKAVADYLKSLHSPAPPQDFVFPGYEVVERLYQGDDRAEVIAKRKGLRHCPLQRLRIFFPSAVDDAEKREELREKATATLNAVSQVGEHPNILKVWPVPNENNYIIEASDWSSAGTLRDVLNAEGKIDPKAATSIFAGILRGLEAIHKHYVIHRMLSPENILMVNGVPKLMNFELSYQLEENRHTVIPDVSNLKRNPYTAPEIFRANKSPEVTADLFSAGVILYEMLTGKKPFSSSTDLKNSDGHLSEPELELISGEELPGKLKPLIFDLVQENPLDRPAPARAVLEKLQEIQKVPQPVNRKLEVGERHSLYEIEEFLEQGAASQLYKARGAQGKEVVLKLFNLDFPLSRVVDEERFAGAVSHPCTIQVENYGVWEDKRHFIAFDPIAGDSLRDEIESERKPELKQFVDVARRLLDALAAMHANEEEDEAKPILHNDIKPENILMRPDRNPVLIDFGSASYPRVAEYEGTEGYVAPDLCRGTERQYCPDGDLYSLGVTLYEWKYGHRPGIQDEEAPEPGSGLSAWLKKATSPNASERFGSADEMLKALDTATRSSGSGATPGLPPATGPEDGGEQEGGGGKADKVVENPFVAYLNSLHPRGAGSENALAESQARNDQFSYIHVSHPLANKIEEVLRSEERQHVVLTGHAGDGKSTIALELFKRFSGMAPEEALDRDIQRRENLTVEGRAISLVKDFSEWSRTEQEECFAEMLREDGPRFLLISNTGTLLNAFTEHERRASGNEVAIESAVLEKFDSSVPQEFSFHDVCFNIINLSMADNLGMAEKIFGRMIAPERWEACKSKDCRRRCPIFRNVNLIQENDDIVRERLFLAYRRMYEYGTRLTLRQLTAHVAYMLTSGASCAELGRKAQPGSTKFMFFNRFFGDDGESLDAPALQLPAVRAVRDQGFGTRLCPTLERRLWMKSEQLEFKIQAQDCQEEFGALRRRGAQLSPEYGKDPLQAREQVRRMLYFLHAFLPDENGVFLRTYLNSSMILDFAKWQKDSSYELSGPERSKLSERILHVLQEHFTGIRFPERKKGEEKLYITLSRKNREVRQSAQIVLASFPQDEFKLYLVSRENGMGGKRRILELQGRTEHTKAKLPLALPFLDYVMLRNQGEVGDSLDVSYVDRLEKFKAELIQHNLPTDENDIIVVRLGTDQELHRQVFSTADGILEVTSG